MIAAVCIYYKPHPHLLDRLLCSLVGRVGHAFFLDGPYKGLSEDTSTEPETEEVFARYEHLLSMTLVKSAIYDSEAHKRMAGLVLAKKHFVKITDVLGIDCDEALLGDVTGPVARICQDGTPTCCMRRVYPLTKTLRWGPGHADVSDDDHLYWTPRMVRPANAEAQFSIMHTPADKRIQAEYDTYNATIRPQLEAM